FRCRLIHLKIILWNKPLEIGLCNKAIVSHKLIFNIFELISINIFVSRGSIRFKIAIFERTIYLDAKMINILVLYFD
ncbi:hypothetical protein PU912_15550, partial [Acinetobacter baumannii]|nr:hypothetical protein [Acinetobacter baumannii]MDO8919360.1 hypothetical protein [Acinetobacter baumannii]